MINREEFLTNLLRYASSDSDPDEIINKMLFYLGKELNSDRAYIFEENSGGTFDNTYEWCNEGVNAEIQNLQNLPYDLMEVWIKEYQQYNNIFIKDIEAYKEVSLDMYNVLKPQGIKTLITGPLELNNKYIGFFGVDNPPLDIMEDVSAIITLLQYSLAMTVRHRDNVKALKRMSFEDQLTSVRNRQALEYDYENRTDKESPIAVLMCDVNGLKVTNDTLGHEAGDKLIISASNALAKVFGKDNTYRIGGDEFLVIKQNITEEDFENRLKKLKTFLEIQDVHVAMGHVYYFNSKQSLQTLMKEADSKMYADKAAFYANSGIERRRKNKR